MHVTALVGGLRHDLADRRLEGGMVVGDDELDPMQTALAQADEKSRQLDRLSRFANSTPSTWRRPSQSMPMAISTAWPAMTPASRTFS